MASLYDMKVSKMYVGMTANKKERFIPATKFSSPKVA